LNDAETHQQRSLGLVEVVLPPGWEEGFLHLLECAECRTVVAARLRDASLLAGAGEPDYDAVLYDLELSLPGLLRVFEEKSAEAQRLYERLMEVPAERRRELAVAPEFRNLQVADLVLRSSASAAVRDPEKARELAAAALEIAGQYTGAESDWAMDVRIAAWSRLGDLERRLGHWAAAEEWFARAGRAVAAGAHSVARAPYCRLLAHLRRDQGNVDEAAGLLWRAATFFNLLADGLEAGRCYSELGFLLIEDDPEQALMPLQHAQDLFDREKERGLGVVARYGLVLALASAGRSEAALRKLEEGAAVLKAVSRGEDVRWIFSLEGRALALLGDEAGGAELLNAARQAHLAAREYHEASLAVVDLAVARAAAGQPVEAEILLRDFETAGDGARERARHRVLERFLGLAASPENAGDLEEAALLAKRRLRRLRAQPEAVTAEMNGEAA
jgi:tetratricopeptide (TPR) repeat protein